MYRSFMAASGDFCPQRTLHQTKERVLAPYSQSAMPEKVISQTAGTMASGD